MALIKTFYLPVKVMIGDYAASFLPVAFVPMLAIVAFAAMGLFFIYVETEA